MTLKEKKEVLINDLNQQVARLDKGIDRCEKEISKYMKEIESYKENRQSTLSLLHEIRKIKA
ncbi:hypothetical protein [Salinicoccus carnicancri]|uniref:hypothetical protein n=1 Tax=Salinicoccus carnicancri TaxID=558170 RepID=UPI0003773D5B|nr:hypothetical protein [Salinicoccus carnicancri]